MFRGVTNLVCNIETLFTSLDDSREKFQNSCYLRERVCHDVTMKQADSPGTESGYTILCVQSAEGMV